MAAMNSTPSAYANLRVLVTGAALSADNSIVIWLVDQEGFTVSAAGIADAFAVAETFKPQAVLFDFHGLPVSIGYLVRLFKGLSCKPKVFVLTHDDSSAMRRRCGVAGVDAVFDKTAELDELCAALEALRLQAGAAGKSRVTDLVNPVNQSL